MPTYLTVAEFRDRTVMAPQDVDLVESKAPGFIDCQIAIKQEMLDARLRKRYSVPFVGTVNEAIKGWLTRIVTPEVMRKRGARADDPMMVQVIDGAAEAVTEIKEAADSQIGLYDLPLTGTTGVSGIAYGGPRAYAEQSPYTWKKIQAEAARDERWRR